jgi:uncharacterized delta-60 repeat protein
MRSLSVVIFIAVFLLTGCGGEKPPSQSENQSQNDSGGDDNDSGTENPLTPEIPLDDQSGEIDSVTQLINGQPVDPNTVVSDSFANGVGSLRQVSVGEGNLTLGVSAQDPDGLSEVSLFIPSLSRNFVLCATDCGTDFQITLTGINPQLLGATPGSIRFELFVSDTLDNRVGADALNANWQPIQISALNASRENGQVSVNWAGSSTLERYNLYAATQYDINKESILSLDNGLQQLAIFGTSTQFIDADPSKEYHVLLTGIDSDGESGFSATLTIPRSSGLANQAPIANADNYQIEEDQTLVANIIDNDSDNEGQAFTLSAVVVQPVNGTVISDDANQLIYTPLINFVGQDSFVYQITDSEGASAQATVLVDISAVNDNPVANNDSYVLNLDKSLTITSAELLTNDSDVDGDTLSVVSELALTPSFGTVEVNDDGSFSYSATDEFVDQDSFDYQISDGQGGESLARVYLLLNTSDQPPIAQNDEYQTNEDSSLIVNLIADGILANDNDPNDRSFQLVDTLAEPPQHGQLNLAVDGTFSYIPDSDFFGFDQFQYRIINSAGVTTQAMVTIEVLAQNDAPITANNSYQVDEDSTLNITETDGLLNNDLDPDLGSLTVTITPTSAPSQGNVTLQGDGSFVYTADANFNGVDSFSYQVTNTSEETNTAQVFISVLSVNDIPVAQGDSYSVDEDATLNGSTVLSNDSDADGDTLVIDTTPISGVSKGNLTLFSDGTFTYVPTANSTDSDSFTYSISDGNGGTAQAVVTITVNAINDDPTAVSDSFSLNEDTVLNGTTLLANDSDIEGDSLTINTTPTVNVTNGSLLLAGDGSFSYTPNSGYFGNDTFSYELLDGNGGTATTSVNLSIASVNDIPVAQADSYAVDEDTMLAGSSVLVNDSDPDGDTLVISTTAESDVTNGNLTLFANGTFSYLADGDFNGVDSFTYTVEDGQGGSETAIVSITVNPINDAPTASSDSYSLSEGASLNVGAAAANRLLINDSDIDGDVITLSTSPVVNVSNGSLTLNSDGSFVYTPTANYSGSDSFTYQIDDGKGATANATVALSVTNINDAPVANNDSFTMTNGFTLSAASVLTNDSDVDGDILTINTTPIAPPSSGTLVLAANGTFIYTPTTDGVYNFTYQVNDGKGLNDTGVVTITVNTSNTAPIGVNDNYVLIENHVLNGTTVLSNDTDIDANTLTVNTTPTIDTIEGNLTLNADGSFSYIPNAGYIGSDTFTYELNDGNGGTSTAQVFLNINPNSVPNAMNDSYQMDEDSVLNGTTVLANDVDAEGDTLTINTTAIADVSSGALTINADGSFTYTPNANFTGIDSFTYEVDDGKGDTNQAVVSITVDPVNDLPIGVTDNYSTNEDTVLNGSTVLVNDSDIDGDTLTIDTVAISSTTKGTLVLSSDGSFVYSPNADVNGDDSFIYQVNDGQGGTDEVTVNITINTSNDTPVAVSDSFNMVEDTVLTITDIDAEQLLANDSDTDGDSLTINTTPDSNVSNGSLTLGNDGGFTYTPNADFAGVDSFVYQLEDGQGGVTTGSVLITVSNINDIPVTVNDAYSTDEDSVLNGSSVLLNDSDNDGDSLSLITSAVSGPSNGIVVLSSNGTFVYTANTDFFGNDSFVYQTSDGNGGSANGTVNITVNNINDAPVAVVDSYNVDEDNVLNASTVLTNDSDTEGDSLTVNTTPIVNVTKGNLTLSSDGTFVYTPNADFNGSDGFTYQITDGNAGSDTAVVTITVNSINDIPVAVNDSASTDEDTLLTGASVLINDSDIDVDSLTVTTPAISTTSNGTLVLNSDGSYTYTPDANFNGTDSFDYQVNDGNGGNAQATMTITVNAVNDAPVADVDNYTVNEDSVLTKLVTDGDQLLSNDNDVDGDPLTVNTSPVTAPNSGNLALNSDGSFTYTPNAEFNGSDSFTYQITDGNGENGQAQVNITVDAVNDKPDATDQSFSIDEDKTDGDNVGTVLASDIEGDSLSFAIIGGDASLFSIGSSSGQITVNGTTPLNFENLTQHALSIDITDDGSPNQSTVISVTINVNDVLEPVVPTELASFGRPAADFFELTGEKTQAKLINSHRDGNKIYFVGSQENIDQDIYMVAYNKDGTRDTGFGNNGEQIFDFGHHETVRAIAEKDGKYHLAFERFNGIDTEICFIKVDNKGDLDTDLGVNGVRCTEEQSDLSINDMVVRGDYFFAVGRKRTTNDDLLIIKIKKDLTFIDLTPGDASSLYIITDISGAGRDDEGLAIFEPKDNELLIAGSVSSGEGDIDIFAWLIEQDDGIAIATFNGGVPATYDINGFDDIVQAIGGKKETDFTAYLAGYTTLANGQKEASIIAIDNTGALSSSFPLLLSGSGIATYDVDGDGGIGNGYAEFTGIMFDSDDLYLSGSLYDGQSKQFATRIIVDENDVVNYGMVDSVNYGISGYRKIVYGSDDSFAVSMSLDGDQTTWMPGYRLTDNDTKTTMTITAIDVNGNKLSGAVDGNFTNGKRTINYTSTPSDDSAAIVVKIINGSHAGKFLVASRANENSSNDIVLSRFTSNGALDTTFDLDGHKQVKIGDDVEVLGVIELTSGDFILYGNVTQASVINGIITKLDAEANIDTSFASNGIYTTEGIPDLDVSLKQAAVDSDGKIVAVGSGDDGTSITPFILRLTSSGSIDLSFNTFGFNVGSADDEYNTLVIDTDASKIYVGGVDNNSESTKAMLVVEYQTNGTISPTFKYYIDVNSVSDDSVHKILQDSDGNLYLLGSDLDVPNQVVAVKVLVSGSNGSLDDSFSTDGIASFVMAPANGNALLLDAKLDSNDNIVIAGQAEVNSVNTPMLGRIKPEGSLDNLFNSSGFFSASSCDDEAQLTSLLLLDDTNWVVAGHCYIDATFKNNLDLTQYQLLEP